MAVNPSAGRNANKLIKSSLRAVEGAAFYSLSSLVSTLQKTHTMLSRKQLLNHIYYLRRNGYVDIISEDNKSQIRLTGKGRLRLQNLQMNRLGLLNGDIWDGKWRLVSYDIPVRHNAARRALCRLMSELGCAKLHDSVWIHPLDFSVQIKAIQRVYNVEEHITYFVVECFDREKEFKKRFYNITKTARLK